jgi:hypothetical protein
MEEYNKEEQTSTTQSSSTGEIKPALGVTLKTVGSDVTDPFFRRIVISGDAGTREELTYSVDSDTSISTASVLSLVDTQERMKIQ